MESGSYARPDFSLVHNGGALPTQEIAALSDEELERYLHDCGFWEDAKRYRANPDYLLREIAGGNILIPVGESAGMSNCMFSLNDTCLYLWRQFQSPRTVEDAVMQAKREFSAPDEVLERDIRAFVADYLQTGLLKEDV